MVRLTLAATFPFLVQALDNGFGRTPVLGYNSYNDVACSPNSTWIEASMRALKAKGLADLGYKFFQLDCGWAGFDRQANGSITYDATRFPNGIRPLADVAISLGLEWSMYTDQGVYSCDTNFDRYRPGSLGYERQDALQFAGWNAAYVKIDNCFVDPPANAPKDPRTDFPSRYGVISTALQNVGIKGLLVCQWGTPQISSTGLVGPSAWTPPLSNSYRVSDDIAQGWANVMRITNQAIHTSLLGLSGPGKFADMDLLEVGNPGMTVAEQTTHFAIWAAFKSALMISTNIPNMSDQTLSIFSNRDLIAINQDPLGEPAKLVQRFTGDYDLYQGNLQNGDRVVLIFDQSNRARSVSVPFSLLGIQSANARDLYTGTTVSSATSFTKSIPARGSIVLRLSSIRRAPATTAKVTYYTFPSGRLSGGANLQNCAACSTGQKVGNIGSGASVTISGVRATATTMDVLFDYINCEIGYLSDQGKNLRGATISVNGGAAQTVEFPLTGYNWERDLLKGYKVRLSGFNTNGDNTIHVVAATSVTTWAPDFDRVGVIG
ncbi:putative alpha-galactosidase A [Elsinoe australis]|uniref:Alpha-galactosidase n=1 Tax=Elsinoe australis TaxID=40998 RepID=A0A4U7B7E3_9PEZI|nr:putative alpha-galactosidase A [Elsinoe australis]